MISNIYTPEMETTVLQGIPQSSIDKMVHHPGHYIDGRKFEPKDVIRDWGLNFNKGCVIKYVSRAGRKGMDELVDLLKAREFLDFEIEALKEEAKIFSDEN